MKKFNPNKTVSANSNGIVVSFGDAKKHQFIQYEARIKTVKDIQVNGTKKYQHIDNVRFNTKQKELYSQVVYGFKAYSPEEVKQMSERKKLWIISTYTRAQKVLNNWKQDLIFQEIDDIFTKIFPMSKVAQQLVSTKGHVETPKEDYISFTDLGITRKAIVDKLIEYSILPKNFYQLA